MSSYQREFLLKQHTPMLHFQYNQPGATLRATEVKPKLDKFLIAKAGGIENIAESWFTRGGKALNYKLRFVAQGIPRISNTAQTAIDNRRNRKHDKPTVPIVGSFFANLVSGKGLSVEEYEAAVLANYVETVHYYTPIRVTVVCFIPALMAFLEAHLQDFFRTHNFGTRQNKGFGSFTLDDDRGTDREIAATLREQYDARACYMLEGRNPLREIQKLYDEIKTGIPGVKDSSLLFHFLGEKGIHNEKEYLKNTPVSQWGEVPPEQAMYVRALLGTGEIVTVKTKGTKETFDVDVANVDLDPKAQQPVIERFPSPIFFKVVGNKAFFVGKRIDQVIFDKKFAFSAGENTAVLTTPSLECVGESFIDDFLDYCYREVAERKNLVAFGKEDAQ